ncbi:MAG TPA: penicillin-insensitive murein endopeptidase [Kofleriaceae bacterium]|nr:penicillin-insensitive murein endopeptidase [Kofleriaceae bacterium]
MRVVLAVLALSTGLAAGCAELGVVTDGSTVSFGKPNRGYLLDGVKLPDSGAGFTTREVWSQRGNRYGTDELIALVKGVSKRMKKKVKDVRLVVADLSGTSGGEKKEFHRSHQNGRDVDLLYYMRDAEGKPFEADAMHKFDRFGVALDGSGIQVDIPRTWLLVKDLLTSNEAYVQYIFMYKPIVDQMLAYAMQQKEPDDLVARAAKACKQPGDSAPHNDHMHVRVYCAATDRQFGCVDIGPLELLAEREAEQHKVFEAIAASLPQEGAPAVPTTPTEIANATLAAATPPAPATVAPLIAATIDPALPQLSATDVWTASASTAEATAAGTLSSSAAASFGTLFRAR